MVQVQERLWWLVSPAALAVPMCSSRESQVVWSERSTNEPPRGPELTTHCPTQFYMYLKTVGQDLLTKKGETVIFAKFPIHSMIASILTGFKLWVIIGGK